jgi:5-methylcytosine-specific restriction endonuclease McrA
MPEWRGKTDDSAIPRAVKRRILIRQGNVCAISERRFSASNKPDFDHIVPLWLAPGGHRESNIQAICKTFHKQKTREEAPIRAKTDRIHDKELGLFAEKKPWHPTLRKKMNGQVVRRETKE